MHSFFGPRRVSAVFFCTLFGLFVGCDDGPGFMLPPVNPGDGGVVVPDGEVPTEDGGVVGVDGGPTFCSTVSCGMGTCNEGGRTCNCDPGYEYDAEMLTCVTDACGGTCAAGTVCNESSGSCEAPSCTPDRTVGDFRFCFATTNDGYDVVVTYAGAGDLDLAASEIKLNGADVNLAGSYDAASKTFAIRARGLAPSKYSYVFRMRTSGGSPVRPLFVPMWIGAGERYADFTWNDSIVYQIFTDRFLDGDPSNNLNNGAGTLAQVTDRRSQWQGGDFAGITAKIREGYFDDMGVNTLWISSPILNSHNAQPAVPCS